MEGFEHIKQYYKPIQPAVKKENEKIIYQEVKPTSSIEHFVYCFWQLKTQEPLNEPFVYRVVSDGCIDIFLNHNEPSENFVMGFCRKYTEFPIGKSFDYIGIRFLPAAFPLIFGVDAKTLSNQSQELLSVLPTFSQWITSKIKPSDNFTTIVGLFNQKLTSSIEEQNFQYDQRFLKALICVFEKKGYLETETELDTGLSSRQMRRIFNFYIGTTAKAFSNVVRFQQILHANPSKQDLKENKLYFDVGFFDQAHFIKHFKTFYGVTPSEAFD